MSEGKHRYSEERPPTDSSDLHQAKKEAELARERAVQRASMIDFLTQGWRRIHDINHISDLIKDTIRE